MTNPNAPIWRCTFQHAVLKIKGGVPFEKLVCACKMACSQHLNRCIHVIEFWGLTYDCSDVFSAPLLKSMVKRYAITNRVPRLHLKVNPMMQTELPIWKWVCWFINCQPYQHVMVIFWSLTYFTVTWLFRGTLNAQFSVLRHTKCEERLTLVHLKLRLELLALCLSVRLIASEIFCLCLTQITQIHLVVFYPAKLVLW